MSAAGAHLRPIGRHPAHFKALAHMFQQLQQFRSEKDLDWAVRNGLFANEFRFSFVRMIAQISRLRGTPL